MAHELRRRPPLQSGWCPNLDARRRTERALRSQPSANAIQCEPGPRCHCERNAIDVPLRPALLTRWMHEAQCIPTLASSACTLECRAHLPVSAMPVGDYFSMQPQHRATRRTATPHHRTQRITTQGSTSNPNHAAAHHATRPGPPHRAGARRRARRQTSGGRNSGK